jgi:hypothetical protein
MWRLFLPRNHIEAHITAARAQIENLPGELRQLDLSTNRIGSLPKGCGGWYRGPRAEEEAETSRRAGEVPLASRLQGLSLAYHHHDHVQNSGLAEIYLRVLGIGPLNEFCDGGAGTTG